MILDLQRSAMILGGRFGVLMLLYIILLTVYVTETEFLQKPFKTDSRNANTKPGSYQEAPVPGKRNIFFLETSCALMNFPKKSSNTKTRSLGGGLRMTARTACALEAAARAHPLRPVYYVHTCPVNAAALRRSAPLYAKRVLAMANVHLWVVRFADQARGTVVERLLRDGTLAQSMWPARHASDALRLLLLWRFRGTYLDTDVLMLRSLGDLQNFSARENKTIVTNAIMDLASDTTGDEVGEECLRELEDFHPKQYGFNGPLLITRVMKRRCGTDEFTKIAPEKCRGFHLLKSSAFHPVHWKKWEDYFREEGATSVMKSLNGSFGVHVFNFFSSKIKFKISFPSKHPYAQIARRVCPIVAICVGEKKI